MAYPSLPYPTYPEISSRGLVEYSRLIAAAVVSPHFRKELLENPAQALVSGYGGEKFYLAKEDRVRVAAIRASSLPDFAKQLLMMQDM